MVRFIPKLNVQGVLPIGSRHPISGDGVGKHDSVRAADPFSFDVAHRRLAWMFRLSAMMNVGLLGVVIVLVSAFSTLLPLKTTQIALVKASPEDDRLYRVEPISPTVQGFDKMMQQKARRFVDLMLTVDTSQGERLTEGYGLSTAEFQKDFDRRFIPQVKAMLDSGLTRAINIESSSAVGQPQIINGEKQYQYSVDFTRVDSRDGVVTERVPLRAYVIMTLRPQEVPEKDVFENPLGIRVLNMSIQFLKSTPKSPNPETKPEVPAP